MSLMPTACSCCARIWWGRGPRQKEWPTMQCGPLSGAGGLLKPLGLPHSRFTATVTTYCQRLLHTALMSA